jgi:hypothetical protein
VTVMLITATASFRRYPNRPGTGLQQTSRQPESIDVAACLSARQSRLSERHPKLQVALVKRITELVVEGLGGN